MIERHRFILVFDDTRKGSWEARRAVNKWLIEGLFDESVWTAFFERIEAYENSGDVAIVAAVVDIEDDMEE